MTAPAPPPLKRPPEPADDPVAALAREAGRRAAQARKERLRAKLQAQQAASPTVEPASASSPPPGSAARQAPTKQAPATPAPVSRTAPLTVGPEPHPPPVRPRPAIPGTAAWMPNDAPEQRRSPPDARADAQTRAQPAPAQRRRRSARPLDEAQRSAARRARRRRHGLLAGGVLGLLSLAAVGGLYQLLGGAPAPVHPDQLAWRSAAPPGAGVGGWAAAPIDTSRSQMAAAPGGDGGTLPGLPPAPPPMAAAPAMVATADTAPRPGDPPRVTAGGRPAAGSSVLPFMPGTQVMESDAEPQSSAGGGTTWAATLTSSEPVDRIAAYYRKTLTQGQSGTEITEVAPGPGQVLLSLGNPAEGSHSAVWIGFSDGQTLIRLMRTQGGS